MSWFDVLSNRVNRHIENIEKSTIIITAIIIIIAVSISASVLIATPKVEAQDSTKSILQEKTISVSGIATSYVKPDHLSLVFGVETQEKTAKEALDSNSGRMNIIISAIKKTGVSESEISTSSFNISPVYESYEDKITGKWTQEIIGYSASNIVIVKTDNLSSASTIIDTAVNSGVNRVDSVYFTLSSASQNTLKDDLLEQAIINAKARATKALEPLDYQIVGIKHVSLDEFVVPYSNPIFEVAMDKVSRGQTPVFSSDQEVSTSAHVVFLIEGN